MQRQLATIMIALVLAVIAGCAASRGELEAELERRTAERISDISSTSLEQRSRTEPETVDEDLNIITARRETLPPAGRDGAVTLSIDQLRAQTLLNNLLLDVRLFDPAVAETRVGEEQAKFDPTITGSVRYSKKNPPELDGDIVSISSDDDVIDGSTAKFTEIEQSKENIDVNLGIELPLATGATVKILSYVDENDKLSPARFEEFISGMKFSISQPLLRGGGIEANTASIRLARLDAHAARARTKLSAIKVLVDAEKAYWRVYEARKILEVRQQQYNAAFDNLELVRKRVAEGASPRIEIVRAEVGVSSRLEDLIIAETRFRLIQRALKLLLNRDDLPLEAADVIDTVSPPQVVRFDLDADDLVADAMANRMELLEVELQMASDAERVALARNQALPVLNVDLEYGILDRSRSLSRTWTGLWDFDNDEFAVGLSSEIPLTNDAREARLRRARLVQSQRLATRQQREMTIRQDIYDALDILEQNWNRMLAARQNVIVSGVNYEAELKQFNEGIRTMREVLEALASLGEAQRREVKAIVAYQMAQIDMAYATGNLLAYGDVDGAAVPIDFDEPVRTLFE